VWCRGGVSVTVRLRPAPTFLGHSREAVGIASHIFVSHVRNKSIVNYKEHYYEINKEIKTPGLVCFSQVLTK